MNSAVSKPLVKLKVVQVRSTSGSTKRTRATLDALGLGSIGAERVYESKPAVLGMIKKISHLVVVEVIG